MNRVTIFIPRVRLKIDGADVPVVSLQLSSKVNSYPTLHVVTFQEEHGDTDRPVHRLSTEEIMSKMQEQQDKMFQVRGDPDVELSLSVEPGWGTMDSPIEGSHEINMKGYTVAVTMHYAQNGAYKEFDIIPDYCTMDALNFSIYNTKDIYTQSTAESSTGLPEFKGDVMEYMPQLVEKIMTEENLPGDIKGVDSPVPEIIKRTNMEQHALNQKVVGHFLELLQNSKETFGWEELPELVKLAPIDGAQYYDPKIPDMLINNLKSRSETFLRPMLMCFDSFQAYYRPHWDNVGEIVNWTKAEEDAEEMTIFPTNITMQAGQHRVFPPKYILVQNDTNTQNDSEAVYTQTVQMVFARGYPASQVKEGATCMGVGKPVWFPGLSTFALNTKKGEPESNEVGVTPATQNEDIVEPTSQTITKNYETKEKLLEEWARCCYYRMALSGSNVRVELPLTLGLDPGYYYIIYGPPDDNGGQGKLFEGILESVQHSISFGSDSGKASTSATFTRVRIKDFTLEDE